MNEQLPPKTLRPFLNKRVIVKTRYGVELSGKLIHVDWSPRGHGVLGNLILQWNGRLAIIRGDSVRFIALNGEGN